jgi:hypothetical protein
VDETQPRLDGNAAAGMLRELFVHEMSTARGACASCGTIAQIGSQHLYMAPILAGPAMLATLLKRRVCNMLVLTGLAVRCRGLAQVSR